ncbi:Transposase for transposon Tn5 [Neorhodopirellula pilleata]|uniref:Transposase for transposon Tn5 n=1 Tax=Neorhodopirellula pilleata TaxID=2714738 RepID=A0A5C6A977_9BACT|nr:Transposase for transposon Tn5 [Neorhodopirellula pilleata]
MPQKLNNPKDLKAFYRLVNRKEVTHDAILQSHRKVTFEKIDRCQSPVLILHDATEMDFTSHSSVAANLGQIGNGHQRGYIAQNSLAVDSRTRCVLGLANQVLHHRVSVSTDETRSQKRERESRESMLWIKGTTPLGTDRKWIDVCDQGADTFEFLEHEVNSGRRFVIRAAYDRRVVIGHDAPTVLQSSKLKTYSRTLAPVGTWTLSVTHQVTKKSPKRNKGKKKKVTRIAREATMGVSFAAVQLMSPQKKCARHGNTPLKVWVVRVWEIDPPEGQEPLEWFLLTNEVVGSFAAAYRVVGWYELRWIVEEYHKGMKTGCQIESPQFTTEERLQPTIALLSIVTLTLLAMRDASRRSDAKIRRASEIISREYLSVLSAWRQGKINSDWTIHEFYYALARLGGHQNRKGDHPPGWQTIWKGWNDLQAMVTGVEAMTKLKKCG